MDNFGEGDAEIEATFDGDPDITSSDLRLIKRFADDLRETYVHPLDVTTRSKHLAAIAGAMSETADQSRAFAAPQRLEPDRGWCAPGKPRAVGAGDARTSTAGLASPFAAKPASPVPASVRSATPARGTSPGPRIQLPAATTTTSAKSKAAARWRPLAMVEAMSARAAAIVALVGIGFSGLAIAGEMPKPVQTAFAEAKEVVGLDVPAPIEAPSQAPTPDHAQQLSAAPPVGVTPEPVATPEVSPPPVTAFQPAPPSSSVQPQAVASVAPSPAAPANLDSWLSELVRQAVAAASARAQAELQPGGQSQVTDSPDGGTAPSWRQYGAGTQSTQSYGSSSRRTSGR